LIFETPQYIQPAEHCKENSEMSGQGVEQGKKRKTLSDTARRRVRRTGCGRGEEGLFLAGNKLLALVEGGKDNNQRLLTRMFLRRFETRNLGGFKNE
jgi:hypothetical protein